MMYERRRIVRKRGEQGEGVASAAASTEIGSRVFPLPTPTAAMLTVARKSSTRVFMPRKAVETDKQSRKKSYSTRVLRSGKHLRLPDPVGKRYQSRDLTDIRWLEKSEKRERRLSEGFVSEPDENEMQGIGKMFENVYSRKRQKIPSGGWIGSDPSSSDGGAEAKDPRFMFVFSRKPNKKKPKLMNGFGRVRGSQFVETKDFFTAAVRSDRSQVRLFDSKLLHTIDITRSEFWTSFSDPIVLVVLLELPCDDILLRFRRFLTSVIGWMTKATRMSLHHLTAFLLSEPISGTFQRHGIHLLPIADRNSVRFRHLQFCSYTLN